MTKKRKLGPPRDYASRREQYRLLVLVSMLMLVVALMNEARKPRTWAWMWARQTRGTPSEAGYPIDTRLDDPPPRENLPEDGFIAAAPTGPSPASASSAGTGLLPGLTPQALDAIKDDSVMRSAESDVWHTILRTLDETPQEVLETSSSGNVGFVQLFRQTDVYRGHLVTVSGIVHRVEPIRGRRESPNSNMLYRWILNPTDGSNSPIVIYSLYKPNRFPLQSRTREFAEFTGVCFKRWAYLASDGTRVAPLLLAKTATWTPPQAAPPAPVPTSAILLGTTLAIALVAILLAAGVYIVSNRERPAVARLRRSGTTPHLEQIKENEVLPSAEEGLQHLADSSRRTGES